MSEINLVEASIPVCTTDEEVVTIEDMVVNLQDVIINRISRIREELGKSDDVQINLESRLYHTEHKLSETISKLEMCRDSIRTAYEEINYLTKLVIIGWGLFFATFIASLLLK